MTDTMYIVWFEKYPYQPYGRSLEIQRGGGQRLKFPRAGGLSIALFPEGGKQFITNEIVHCTSVNCFNDQKRNRNK